MRKVKRAVRSPRRNRRGCGGGHRRSTHREGKGRADKHHGLRSSRPFRPDVHTTTREYAEDARAWVLATRGSGDTDLAWASDASIKVKSALARSRAVGRGCGRGSA